MGKEHKFGGVWTSQKLQVIADYLKSYMIALKKQRFRKEYIDGFAGTGYREPRRADPSHDAGQVLLFPDLADQEPQNCSMDRRASRYR